MVSPQVFREARDDAIRALTALATAKDADELVQAREALKETVAREGWSWNFDPIGVPCVADTDPGVGLTLGCPSGKNWATGARSHVDGHGPRSLMSRMVHCTNVAKAAWPARKGGAA